MKRVIIVAGVMSVLLILDQFISLILNPYITQIIGLIGINIVLVVSLNLITGFTGQFSLGHAGFMAVGAYVSASLTVFCGDFYPSFLNPLFFLIFTLCGGSCAAFCGFLIGLPTLRLKGDYLAIVTLGFGEIIRVIILNIQTIGGARGFSGIPERASFFWIYFWVFVVLLVLFRLIGSTKGKAFLCVRDDEIAAESIGIRPTRVKVTAFVIGSFFAGTGGALFAHFNTYLNPSSFTFLKSVEIVTMVVLGGLGSLSGSVLSALLLTALPELLRIASDFRMVLYSLLLIVVMIKRPQGIMGMREINFKFKMQKLR